MYKLNNLGFDKIAFPILIRDGADLNLVYLEEFATDADLYYHEFDNNFDLIDSNGKVWNWKYDTVNKTNLPDSCIKTITLDEVRKIVNTYFANTKMKNEIQAMTEETNSIYDLLENLENKF
ncbi:MAG: hypothetical protein NTX03_01050 [Bacteroidetes bacterium]|nr:hypothetical protein [Bacteroidota bacterium]